MGREGKELETYKGRSREREERKGGYMWIGLERKTGLLGLHPLQKSCHRSVYELCKISSSLL
jgi:hypothetical protein